MDDVARAVLVLMLHMFGRTDKCASLRCLKYIHIVCSCTQKHQWTRDSGLVTVDS